MSSPSQGPRTGGHTRTALGSRLEGAEYGHQGAWEPQSHTLGGRGRLWEDWVSRLKVEGGQGHGQRGSSAKPKAQVLGEPGFPRNRRFCRVLVGRGGGFPVCTALRSLFLGVHTPVPLWGPREQGDVPPSLPPVRAGRPGLCLSAWFPRPHPHPLCPHRGQKRLSAGPARLRFLQVLYRLTESAGRGK